MTVITAHGVPTAVSSSTKDVMASCAAHAKWPRKTKTVARAATTYVAWVRLARGRIASRSRPMEYSISPALPTEPAEAARSSGARNQNGAPATSGPA